MQMLKNISGRIEKWLQDRWVKIIDFLVVCKVFYPRGPLCVRCMQMGCVNVMPAPDNLQSEKPADLKPELHPDTEHWAGCGCVECMNERLDYLGVVTDLFAIFNIDEGEDHRSDPDIQSISGHKERQSQ